jgi:hypothetical protein
MLRLLQEQRERLDALADIWARVQAAPVPPTPVAPQAEPATPDTAPDLVGTVSAGGAAVANDATADDRADVAKAGIAAATVAADLRLDPTAGADPEPYDIDIPTSELLGRASLFELGIDSPPADMPRDEFQPPELPAAETSTGTDSLKWEFGGGDEPADPAQIEPAAAAAAPDDILIETGHRLPAGTVEAAPDELRLPERVQLPAWLVGAVEPESLAGLDLQIAQEPPAAAEPSAAPEPQTAPEPFAADDDMDIADTAEACDGATILVSSAPDPAGEPEPVLGGEAELVLEFEADIEPEVVLAALSAPEAESDREPEIGLEAEAQPSAGLEPEAEPALDTEAERHPDVLINDQPESDDEPEPAFGHDIEAQARLALQSDPGTTSNPAALAMRAPEPSAAPPADDEVRAPATGSDQEPDLEPGPEAEHEFNPVYALAELRRILGLDPTPPAERSDIAPLDEADNAPACETLEEALANDVIEVLPAAAASASQPPADARVSRSASDPLDPVRALSEEERIALFS